jgi:hypothetical protein
MEWKSLTKQQKIARLEKQSQEIKNAQTLLEEFARLTNDWIKKVEATPTSQNKPV